MNELHKTISDHIRQFDLTGAETRTLTNRLLEVIEHERRAAAEAMRDRCINVCKEHYPETLPDRFDYTIGEHTALTIRDEIEALPLDSDGGA